MKSLANPAFMGGYFGERWEQCAFWGQVEESREPGGAWGHGSVGGGGLLVLLLHPVTQRAAASSLPRGRRPAAPPVGPGPRAPKAAEPGF